MIFNCFYLLFVLIINCLCFFSKAFPKGVYVNIACFITFISLEGSISSPVRYLYLYFLKREGLSDARVASRTKKEYGFAVHFL